MNVDEALKNIKNCLHTTTESRVLSDEVIRLREQRGLLYSEVPLHVDSEEIDLIGEEIRNEKQKEEKKMTVDQAISESATPQEKVLVTEVNRLNKGIREARKEVQFYIGKLRDMKQRCNEIHEDWKENRKKLGEEVRCVLKSYGV